MPASASSAAIRSRSLNSGSSSPTWATRRRRGRSAAPERRDASEAVVDQLLLLEHGSRAQLDEGRRHFRVARVGRAHDLRDLDVRVREEERLHLGGGDVLAADLEHVLEAADERDAAVLVEAAEVARVEPALVVDRERRVLGVLVVADEAHRPAHQDLPVGAGGKVGARLGLDDAELDAGERVAGRRQAAPRSGSSRWPSELKPPYSVPPKAEICGTVGSLSCIRRSGRASRR